MRAKSPRALTLTLSHRERGSGILFQREGIGTSPRGEVISHLSQKG
jgi:hypothetical protein